MHFQSIQLKQNSLPQAVVHPSFRSIYNVTEEVEDIYKTNSPRAIQYRNFCQLVGLCTEIPPSWEKTLQKKTLQLISPIPYIYPNIKYWSWRVTEYKARCTLHVMYCSHIYSGTVWKSVTFHLENIGKKPYFQVRNSLF